eukprot:COSAG05_NODE_3304_length_2163_cov_1.624213_1_plen_55_part_10
MDLKGSAGYTGTDSTNPTELTNFTPWWGHTALPLRSARWRIMPPPPRSELRLCSN